MLFLDSLLLLLLLLPLELSALLLLAPLRLLVWMLLHLEKLRLVLGFVLLVRGSKRVPSTGLRVWEQGDAHC